MSLPPPMHPTASQFGVSLSHNLPIPDHGDVGDSGDLLQPSACILQSGPHPGVGVLLQTKGKVQFDRPVTDRSNHFFCAFHRFKSGPISTLFCRSNCSVGRGSITRFSTPTPSFSDFHCKQSTYSTLRLGHPCATLGWRLGHPWATQTQSQSAEGRMPFRKVCIRPWSAASS
jgi:hypothetical protein